MSIETRLQQLERRTGLYKNRDFILEILREFNREASDDQLIRIANRTNNPIRAILALYELDKINQKGAL